MVILLNDRVNMKQIALIILLFVNLTINDQQINYSSNHYRYGDMLEKKQVAGDDRGQSRDILLSTSIARIIALEYKPNRKG